MLPAPYQNAAFLAWNPGRRMAAHRHDYLQIIHVLDGVMHVDCEAGLLLLRPGEVHCLPPGSWHALHAPGGERQFGINFRAEADERGLLPALIERLSVPCRLRYVNGDEILSDIRRELHRPEQRPLPLAQALDRYCQGLLESSAPDGADGEPLLRLLERHADRAVGVAELAGEFGVSRATLQRRCQRRFACGVGELHERLRLQRAARRLLERDCSITACAEASGYADLFQFSRAFKRRYGSAPSRYRQTHRDAGA